MRSRDQIVARGICRQSQGRAVGDHVTHGGISPVVVYFIYHIILDVLHVLAQVDRDVIGAAHAVDGVIPRLDLHVQNAVGISVHLFRLGFMRVGSRGIPVHRHGGVDKSALVVYDRSLYAARGSRLLLGCGLIKHGNGLVAFHRARFVRVLRLKTIHDGAFYHVFRVVRLRDRLVESDSVRHSVAVEVVGDLVAVKIIEILHGDRVIYQLEGAFDAVCDALIRGDIARIAVALLGSGIFARIVGAPDDRVQLHSRQIFARGIHIIEVFGIVCALVGRNARNARRHRCIICRRRILRYFERDGDTHRGLSEHGVDGDVFRDDRGVDVDNLAVYRPTQEGQTGGRVGNKAAYAGGDERTRRDRMDDGRFSFDENGERIFFIRPLGDEIDLISGKGGYDALVDRADRLAVERPIARLAVRLRREERDGIVEHVIGRDCVGVVRSRRRVLTERVIYRILDRFEDGREPDRSARRPEERRACHGEGVVLESRDALAVYLETGKTHSRLLTLHRAQACGDIAVIRLAVIDDRIAARHGSESHIVFVCNGVSIRPCFGNGCLCRKKRRKSRDAKRGYDNKRQYCLERRFGYDALPHN